ncbi:MAG: GTPase Era [Caldisericaceae bacterium]|nr:GTPase Era [Caldisericaceae bacterium]
MKSGLVAILGRPNVGKSTLMNYLVGSKVSIVTPKPQTTRFRILGVKNLDDAQIVFVDTPGVHQAKSALNKYMVEVAKKSIEGVDLIYLMVEAGDYSGEEYRLIFDSLNKTNIPVFLVINKIDKHQKEEIEKTKEEFKSLFEFKEVVEISALNGQNVDVLLEKTLQYLPEGPAYFPKDMLTDIPLALAISEIIREKLYLNLRKELPYSSAVNVEEIKERENGMMYIRAVISVARDSQKGIVIGEKGKMIKKIGQEARLEIQEMLKKPVFLELFVRVEEDWPKFESKLKKLGYVLPE